LDRDLTNEELIQTRPNRRVVRIETYNSYNKKGKPFQVLCKDESLNHKGATPVTIYKGVWWYLKKGSNKTEFALSKPVPSLHDFDLTIEASDIDAPVQTHTPDDPQSPEARYTPGDDPDKDDSQTALDLQIRNSPLCWAGILPSSLHIPSRIAATISPSYPAPTMASMTTQTLTSTQPPPAQPQTQPTPPLTKQQIDDAFN
jgi:hypothetical protein